MLWDAKLEMEGSAFAIDGLKAGRCMGFRDFCRDQGVSLEKFSVPDAQVQVMERDYLCPRRGRIVLHSGAAYGAPVYLHSILHRKSSSMPDNLLEHLVLDLSDDEAPPDRVAENRHAGILARLQNALVFAYHEADESISMDNQHLIKGVSAKILRKLLAAYVNGGQSEFEYREFKRDFEISLGQKNSNFEVRFTRLVNKLDEKKAGVRIEKRGRGKFALVAERPVTLFSLPAGAANLPRWHQNKAPCGFTDPGGPFNFP